MSKLEELKPNSAVRGILPDCLATVVSVQWFGSEALELTYKACGGWVSNEVLYRHDEPRLEVVTEGRPWSFDGDGRELRLVVKENLLKFDATPLFPERIAYRVPYKLSRLHTRIRFLGARFTWNRAAQTDITHL